MQYTSKRETQDKGGGVNVASDGRFWQATQSTRPPSVSAFYVLACKRNVDNGIGCLFCTVGGLVAA